MMTQTAQYIVHCHFCQGSICSESPSILDDRYPMCALCELSALLTDGDFAWIYFDRDVNPNDEDI